MPQVSGRRIIILAEGKFSPLESKTANQALRYIPDEVVAVIDSRQAGYTAQQVLGFGGAVPVVSNLVEGLRLRPNTLLIGIAPTGGRLPEDWRGVIKEAIAAKLNVISGLHSYLSDDREFAALAQKNGVVISDLRKVPEEYEVVAQAKWKSRKAKTILTVGTDCNVGKMTASYELNREFQRRGLPSAFVATGQTGILLSGRGIAVDSILSDYVAGAIEHEIDSYSDKVEFLHVEGQGSLLHQGYSGVTLGLMHGTMPDAMVLVHHPARQRDQYDCAIAELGTFIKLHEAILAPFKQSKVAGIAVNTVMMTSHQADSAIRSIEEQTGLPTVNVLSPGVVRLADALLEYMNSSN